MSFDYENFSRELYEQFKEKLSIEEISDLLRLEETYTKDSSESTGKNLVINQIFFKGLKNNGDSINYKQDLSLGINIWIADSFKGKSTVFKIIKYALTGQNSLKPDVKKWIHEILVTFSLGNKHYSIYLNLEGARAKVKFYNSKFINWEGLYATEKDPIFTANSETEYINKIQEFFFNQFSYYSLKWTQKNSAKDSNDLIEASTSWKTYFKSIYLESKDSYDLTYGDQGKKIFQMLLGLELTYPINQLKVKMDFQAAQKGKEQLISDATTKKNSQEKESLLKELSAIEEELKKLNTNPQSKTNSENLRANYNALQLEYNSIWEKTTSFDKKAKELSALHQKLESDRNIKVNEIALAAKEIDRNKKRIIDLKEYLEIGIFFSNLDIQHCPSCSHSVSSDKKKAKHLEHKCALCDETVLNSEEINNYDDYNEKIQELEAKNISLENLIKNYKIQKDKIQIHFEKTYSDIVYNQQQKSNLKDLNVIYSELNQIEESLKKALQEQPFDNRKRDDLISRKAVIQFQLNEIEKQKRQSTPSNYEDKIALLSTAINKLSTIRYESSKIVLKRLESIMLKEMQEFGLNSISEVRINEKFDILYIQNEEFITFNDITEGEQLRAKIAFYLSLIQLDIEYNTGKHTRFLMIDSPNKEEGDAKYLEGLSSVLKSIQDRFGSQLQILIATAERRFLDVLDNQYVIPSETYLF